MTTKMIIPTHYEFETGDSEPTGVPLPVTTLRDTLTNAMYVTYDGGTTWIVADMRVRLVGEDGSFLALDEQLDDLLGNIAVIEHHEHSRSRVYPQDIEAVKTLIAGTPADTFGAWIEIIPINTVDFLYEVVGVLIEATNASTSYLIQLGFSLVAGTDPVTSQVLGERRVVITTPVSKAQQMLHIYSQDIPANAKLWGRVKSASGAADQLGVSVIVLRHVEITNPLTMITTWPWST